jgi:putative heme transporter
VQTSQTEEESPPAKPTRWWLRGLVAVVVLVAIFGFGIPRLADYGEAWEAITAMSGTALVGIAVVGAWNLYTYWPVLKAALPGLRTREAIVVNQASTAVANSVPGGGAVAMAATFRILRAWGFTSQSITNQIVATGTANVVVKLVTPVVALGLVTVTGDATGTFLTMALAGLVATAVVGVVAVVVLRAEHATERAGAALDRLVNRFRRHRDRDPEPRIAPWLLDLRSELTVLAKRDGLRLAALTLVSHLSLYVVLLVCLRAVGVGEDEVSWSIVFAAFAFVRLLSALPITPGGTGVVELGYVGFLSSEASSGMTSQITAGVLVFRAVTFALPLGFGSLAWLVFQSATSWRNEPDTRGQVDDG